MKEKTVKIFLEGNDIVFIKNLLDNLNIPLSDENIVNCGGFTALEDADLQTLLSDNSYNDGINLVIFDADFEENQGGFLKRKAYLEKIKKDFGLDFELFLFPNNQDDGDLEELLTQIATHKLIFDCLDEYEKCISQKGFTPKLRNTRKARIYSYASIIPKSNSQNEAFKRDFSKKTFYLNDTNYWKIESDELKPLKEFLKKYFL